MSPVKTPRRTAIVQQKTQVARKPIRAAIARGNGLVAYAPERTYYFLDDRTGEVVSAVCVADHHNARGVGTHDVELATDAGVIHVEADRVFRSFGDCAVAFGLRKPGPGRPRVATKRETPVRQLGRVNDVEFEEMQNASRALGLTFSEFARETLLRRARDVIRRHNDANA